LSDILSVLRWNWDIVWNNFRCLISCLYSGETETSYEIISVVLYPVCTRCLSFTWAQTGYQTTEVISYDVSVSPKYRQDIRQRKLFHTMSQSHLSTDRISDNGSYFIRCFSFTWAQTGYQTTEVISYDVSVSLKYRQDIRKRKLFHTMSQSHLSTGRISDNGSYFIRCLSPLSDILPVLRWDWDIVWNNFRFLISCLYLGETETSYEITSVVWYPVCAQVKLRHRMK
jgi:uncharacterized protein YifE (UPF0438 family)